MKRFGALILLLFSGCGEQPELFCQGVVKQVTEDSSNYKIEFCDGTECQLYKYRIKERGIPSGRISVWYLPDDEEFDMQFEEAVPGCQDGTARTSGKVTKP